MRKLEKWKSRRSWVYFYFLINFVWFWRSLMRFCLNFFLQVVCCENEFRFSVSSFSWEIKTSDVFVQILVENAHNKLMFFYLDKLFFETKQQHNILDDNQQAVTCLQTRKSGRTPAYTSTPAWRNYWTLMITLQLHLMTEDFNISSSMYQQHKSSPSLLRLEAIY